MRFPWTSDSKTDGMSDQSWSRRNIFGHVRRSPVVEIPMLSRFKRKRDEDEGEEPEFMRIEKRPRRGRERDREGSSIRPENMGATFEEHQQRRPGSSASNAEAANHMKRQDLCTSGHSRLGGSNDDLPPIPSMR